MAPCISCLRCACRHQPAGKSSDGSSTVILHVSGPGSIGRQVSRRGRKNRRITVPFARLRLSQLKCPHEREGRYTGVRRRDQKLSEATRLEETLVQYSTWEASKGMLIWRRAPALEICKR